MPLNIITKVKKKSANILATLQHQKQRTTTGLKISQTLILLVLFKTIRYL